MNYTYENQGTTSFLSYAVAPEEEIDSMGLGMVQNNKITGVLPIAFTQIDKERYLRYNISSTVTLDNFLSGIVTRSRLLSVFESICDAFLGAEEYLLENSFFVLEKDYMFCDVSTGKTSLVYLPICRETDALNLAKFFKETIFSVQSDLNEDGSHVAHIINYLNSNDNFSLVEFRQLIVQLKNAMSGRPAAAPRTTAPAPVVAAAPVRTPAPVRAAAPTPVPASAPASVPASAPVSTPVPPASVPTPAADPAPKKGLFGGKKDKKEQSAPAAQGFAVPGGTAPAAATAAAAAAAAPVASASVKEGKPSKTLNPVQKMPPLTVNGVVAPSPTAPAAEPAPKKGLFGGKKDKKAEATPVTPTAFAVPGAPSTPVAAAVPPVTTVPAYATPASAPVTRPAAAEPTFTPVAPVPSTPSVQQAPITGQGTTVLTPEMLNPGTTVLTPGMMPGAAPSAPKALVITRLSTKEQVRVTKNIFRIGKERSYVDYFIADNSAISRSHADIIIKDGEYFLRDNNSLNHTYVDDAILQSNQEYPIKPGSKIVLADEEFSLALV